MNLAEAISRWRETRDVELARHIDELSAQIPIEPAPPFKEAHRWWVERAQTYDPIVVTSLLAHITVHARGSNVPWRVVHARETPLARYIRPIAPRESKVPFEYLNLIDRVGLALLWPDDPRMITRLAELLTSQEPLKLSRWTPRESPGAPCRAAILDRAVEMREVRALEILGAVLPSHDEVPRTRIRDAVGTVPAPSEPRNDPQLDGLWDAIAEAPDELDRRLVLADALTERGDPRGEMIALQCAPLVEISRGTTEDPNGLFGRSAERVGKLIDANWHRWLGDVALVATRASKFSGGLLADVTIGPLATPSWAWERAARHRELCAVRRLDSTNQVSPRRFLDFAHALPRPVRWLYLRHEHVLALDRPPRASGVMLRRYNESRTIGEVVRNLFSVAPGLEYLGIVTYRPDDVQALCAIAPGLKVKHLRLIVESRVDMRAEIEELRQLPFVRVDAYGL